MGALCAEVRNATFVTMDEPGPTRVGPVSSTA